MIFGRRPPFSIGLAKCTVCLAGLVEDEDMEDDGVSDMLEEGIGASLDSTGGETCSGEELSATGAFLFVASSRLRALSLVDQRSRNFSIAAKL